MKALLDKSAHSPTEQGSIMLEQVPCPELPMIARGHPLAVGDLVLLVDVPERPFAHVDSEDFFDVPHPELQWVSLPFFQELFTHQFLDDLTGESRDSQRPRIPSVFGLLCLDSSDYLLYSRARALQAPGDVSQTHDRMTVWWLVLAPAKLSD